MKKEQASKPTSVAKLVWETPSSTRVDVGFGTFATLHGLDPDGGTFPEEES